MKAIFRVITLFLALSICLPCFAQSNEEITLTVSSDGPTKDDAIKNALRTAIEQAYGAFVSANTTILNDDLVKDEIVTITTGAIKDYTLISETEKPDGNGYFVTAKATVSLPNLIKYAQNHGSECEFAGNTFGMQMKLWELQKKNELIALDNLFYQAKAILPSQINWYLEVKEPKVAKCPYGDAFRYARQASSKLDSIYDKINYDDFFEIEFKLSCRLRPEYSQQEILNQAKNKNMYFGGFKYLYSPIHNFINKGLKDISMSKEEEHAASKRNEDYTGFSKLGNYMTFRNGRDVIDDKWNDFINYCEQEIFKDICIEDNTGSISDPFLYEILVNQGRIPDSDNYACSFNHSNYSISGYAVNLDNTNLFRYPYYVELYDIDTLEYRSDLIDATYFIQKDYQWEEANNYRDISSAEPIVVTLRVLIPKDEIGKYSSFKIVKK